MLDTALEESSQFKDPFFALEIAVCQQDTDGIVPLTYIIVIIWVSSSYKTLFFFGVNKYYLRIAGDATTVSAWQRMVEAVKVFKIKSY